jgi:hypothetical protein
MMFQSAEEALDDTRPRTIWQRMPVLPGLLGRVMIRSQAPGSERKYKAPRKAQASSDIAADIIQRFVEQHRDAVTWVQSLNDRDAAGSIMASPFLKVFTFSVLDGCRLVVAHDRAISNRRLGTVNVALRDNLVGAGLVPARPAVWRG